MIHEEVRLDGLGQFRFPNGIMATVRLLHRSQPGAARPSESILVQLSTGSQIELPESADNGETTEAPRVHVIKGNPSDQVFLFGGEIAYRLHSDGRVLESLVTYRHRDLDEFWDTKILLLEEEILIVIYETGVIAINQDLQVQWHVHKLVNDFFSHIEGKQLMFLRDHEERKMIDLVQGNTDIVV